MRQKFWSHGTPLGSLGPLSFEALDPGFDQCQILLIWGPYEYLDLVALQVQAEILKTIRSWCGLQQATMFHSVTRLAPENALNDLEVEIEMIACPSRVHKGASDES